MLKYVVAIVLVLVVSVGAGDISDDTHFMPKETLSGPGSTEDDQKVICDTSTNTSSTLRDLSESNVEQVETVFQVVTQPNRLVTGKNATEDDQKKNNAEVQIDNEPNEWEDGDIEEADDPEIDNDNDQNPLEGQEKVEAGDPEIENNAQLVQTDNPVKKADDNSVVPPPTSKYKDLKSSKICTICSCLAPKRPKTIDCSRRNLTENFSADYWPDKVSLVFKTVDYSQNNFEVVEPFHEMPITRLNLSSNGIQVIKPKAFDQLKSLVYLDLSNNNLTHISQTVFQRQSLPLEQLLLTSNQIQFIEEEAFNAVAKLKKLVMNNNPLGNLDRTASAIRKLEKLEILELAKVQLIEIPKDFLANFMHLKQLDLSDNQLITLEGALRNTTGLKYLNINANLFPTLNNQSFIGLNNLEGLEMSSLKHLERIEANTFTPLESLKYFNCSFNFKLKTIHPAAFNITKNRASFIPSEFRFKNNGVSSISSTLLPWNHLDLIDIQGNSFICDSSIDAMINDLIPIIVEKTPELTSNITCSGPAPYQGKSLVYYSIHRPGAALKDPSTLTTTTTSTSTSTSTSTTRTNLKAGLLVVSLFGVLLVVGIGACMGFRKERRNTMRRMLRATSGRIVHYFRTPSEYKDCQREEMNILSQDY